MADTSTQEQSASDPIPHTNGLDGICSEEDDKLKIRPADIDADMREMERRKRVELIMNSRLFREELERIIETQIKDGGAGTGGLLQQIQDMMGIPKHANVFKGSNCVVPINDIRGVESMGYAKGEKHLRCKLAAVYRLMDLYGWAQGVGNQVTARLNQDQEHFLVNPYGMLCHEITASSLVKIDMQGNVVEQGTTNFGVNVAAFSLHAAIHAARPDVKCAIHIHTPAVLAVSALKCGLLPVSQESVVIGEVSTHPYVGGLAEPEEREKVARNLGPINKVLLLANHGAVCCGETVEEAFFNVYNTILACETQLKLMPIGVDNLALVSEETRKQMYEAARKAPDGTSSGAPRPMAAEPGSVLADKLAERKFRVGGVEFEALMRMLDNAGFRTGYIYRNPLVKGDPPRPRNDVEVPPAVSSLGYLLEEEEMYKQGIWKPGRKGNDRTRWLNSPNVYQKVEILETGTPDPKKITKWVADGSPTHSSTPVKIDSALQFVPLKTNPKEFKLLQQQIKDNRRADKISAGPQSHILEGVTWEEAKKMQDAGVTQTGDQVVVVGAASKGIIQRGYQHNAMVYKAPYAKNPFDSVTDEELDEYKKVIERKAKGEYDTDYSESESAQISKRIDNLRSPTSADETEEESRDEPRVLRIETKQAPKPSQPEVVLSDDSDLDNINVQMLNAERIQALQTQEIVVQNSKGSSLDLYKLKASSLALTTPSAAPSVVYRTNSHAGMPRGSYMLPNPIHFHVARYKHTEILQRPLFITFSRQERIHELKNRHFLQDATVTINITNVERPLSVDIPINVLKQFMEPFMTVLNFADNQSRTLTLSSTNSFNLEHFINSKNVNNEVKSSTGSDYHYEYDLSSDEERKILNKQRENLMDDINTSCSILDLDTSFSDVEVIDAIEEDTLPEKVIDFANKINKYHFCAVDNPSVETIRIWENTDEQNNNKLDEEPIKENNLQLDENVDILTTDNYCVQNMIQPENESFDKLRVGTNENLSGESILKSILEISKAYDKLIEENANVLPDNGKYIWPYHNCATAVKELSRKIYKYLMKVCVETIECLEFPEIRCYHDSEEFFDELISIFDKYSDCFPAEKDIHNLKKCIMVTVAKNLEKHFLIVPLTTNNEINKTIEKTKFLSLKKFISLVIYILFDKIENPEFQCTHYDIPDFSDFDCPEIEDIQFHSTPENAELFYTLSETSEELIDDVETINKEQIKPEVPIILNGRQSPEMTTFLAQHSEKTGSLQYWFMINDKVVSPKRSTSMVFNKFMETANCERIRRSSAPARFISDITKPLSPIPEEPRRNLTYDFDQNDQINPNNPVISTEETDSYKTESQTSSSNKHLYEICCDFNINGANFDHYSVSSNNTFVKSKSPIKKRNGKILFMKEITFIPKDNVSTNYTEAKLVNSVTFTPRFLETDDLTSNSYISSNTFDSDDCIDGNWMGYESAKF